MSIDAGYTAAVLFRKHLLTALALSFAIYLVPVVTAHWIDLFGLVLGRELSQERELAWKAADLAFALILQGLLFACVWWVVPRSRLLTARKGATTRRTRPPERTRTRAAAAQRLPRARHRRARRHHRDEARAGAPAAAACQGRA